MGISTQSRGTRLASFDPDQFGQPTGREEEWRFTPIGELQRLFTSELTGQVTIETTLSPGAPITVEQVGRNHPAIGLAPPPGDRLAAAAWAAWPTATVVTLHGNQADAVASVRVIGRDTPASNQNQPSAAHLVVLAQANARGTVILEHRGRAELTQGVEIVLEEGADVTVVAVHHWDPGTIHAASHRARVGKDARLRHVVVSLGGAVQRVTPHLELAGSGAQVEALGINVTSSGQHHEAQLFVDHAAPHCQSRVTYKGALLEPLARSVWIGDVLIRAQAEGTDTYEENRNLVLTKGAQADSVPNLEIQTGRIEGAGHASATGRFDEEQLFYLQARGIPEDQARSMVVHAFFTELISRIGQPEIEAALRAAVDAKLEPTTPNQQGAEE